MKEKQKNLLRKMLTPLVVPIVDIALRDTDLPIKNFLPTERYLDERSEGGVTPSTLRRPWASDACIRSVCVRG